MPRRTKTDMEKFVFSQFREDPIVLEREVYEEEVIMTFRNEDAAGLFKQWYEEHGEKDFVEWLERDD